MIAVTSLEIIRKGGERLLEILLILLHNDYQNKYKINPNNCAHEQLFKASGLVGAEIATTDMKDDNCTSRKEGIGGDEGNDQTDNSPSLCRPEDLFLALARIENELARAWLQMFNGENKFPLIQLQRCLNIICPITTMDMLRLTASYSWIRLELDISRLS